MADEFIISRVSILPEPLVANTMYIVKVPGTDTAELVFVGNDVETVAKSISLEQVTATVEQTVTEAMVAGRSVFVVENIEERNAISPVIPVIAFVKDTSADPLADTASGAYIFDDVAGTWISMGGSGAISVDWNNITGRPSSSPSQIDTAVAASVHANRAVLDKLGESNGELTYNNLPVSNVKFSSDW